MTDHILEKSSSEPKTANGTHTEGVSAPGSAVAAAKITVNNLNFYYSKHQALTDISMPIKAKRVTALIGPSGCGKSTFLRTFNRMNDLIPMARIEGQVLLDGMDIYSRALDVVDLRRKVGMVFQK